MIKAIEPFVIGQAITQRYSLKESGSSIHLFVISKKIDIFWAHDNVSPINYFPCILAAFVNRTLASLQVNPTIVTEVVQVIGLAPFLRQSNHVTYVE